MADAVDGRGRPIGVHQNFLPQAHSITALVQVGNVAGSSQTLTVEWFQDHRNKAPKSLFKHAMKVAAGDRAFSSAVAAGFIQQGDYRVTAELGGTRMTTVFYVRPDPPTSGSAPSGAATLPPGIGDAPQSGPSGDLPANSGATPAAAGGCQLTIDASQVTTEQTDATGCAGDTWTVDAGTGEHQARVGGGTGDGIQVGAVDPCQIGSSDVPGSRWTYTAHVVGGPDSNARATSAVVLGAEKTAPAIVPESTPEPGSVVNSGNKITLTITADDNRVQDAGVSGIASISISSPEGIVQNDTYDTRRGCDPAGLERVMYASYTVPPDPPDVITLTVTVTDQAGNSANVDLQYLTKAEWIGGGVFNATLDSHFVYNTTDGPVGNHCDGRWALQLAMIVKGVGPIHGKALASRVFAKCAVGTTEGATEGTLNVDGNFDGKTFTLEFSPAPLANGYFEGDFDYFLNLDMLFNPPAPIRLPLRDEKRTADVEISLSGTPFLNGCPAGVHDCQGSRTVVGDLSLSAFSPS